MMQRYWAAVLLALVASNAWAQKSLLKISIGGDGIATPLEVTDPAVIGNFNIWNGPSVVIHVQGARLPPTHLDPNVRDGRFVDWPRGIAVQQPIGLKRQEVTFHIGGGGRPVRTYVVAYEYDPVAKQGYIYLPQWTNDLIAHGVEGNWLYATRRWDELIAPLIERHATATTRLEDSPQCKGVAYLARMSGDGTITIEMFWESGKNGKFVYPRSSDEYTNVLMHIGTLDVGTETATSCWPHRESLVSR